MSEDSTERATREAQVRLALPKGRMLDAVLELLADAGLRTPLQGRGYRPRLPLAGFTTKLLKPQSIVEMLQAGSRDVGFTGADWVAELDADPVELLDTGFDPVRIVAAAPETILEHGRLPRRPLVIASEYLRLTQRWIAEQGLRARLVRSYGSTEVLPPEDADCIVDCTASGATLAENRLVIVGELMRSSTRLYASARALDDPRRRAPIEAFRMLLRSVLDARQRVMLEVNVATERLDAVVRVLPCMREPTIAGLHDGRGYAVKVAVPREVLPALIPEVKAAGGTDLVVTKLEQIVA